MRLAYSVTLKHTHTHKQARIIYICIYRYIQRGKGFNKKNDTDEISREILWNWKLKIAHAIYIKKGKKKAVQKLSSYFKNFPDVPQ